MGIQHHQEVLQLLQAAVADAEDLLTSSPEVLVAKLESILKLLNESDMVAPAAGRQTFLVPNTITIVDPRFLRTQFLREIRTHPHR